MSNKAEISWTRVNDEGEKLQVYAHHVGDRWIFYLRHRRYDEWREQKQPPLEDWLALLDAIRRRAQRRLQRPEEIQRVERTIRERFPGSTWE
jgi:hypothetical protein